MATVINTTPAQANDDGATMGFLMGIILLAVVLFLFFVYGLPFMRQASNTPQINVPGKFDVNINQPGK